MKKYELCVITCCYWNSDKEFQKWQKNGWELAGEINIQGDNAVIPIKKLMK